MSFQQITARAHFPGLFCALQLRSEMLNLMMKISRQDIYILLMAGVSTPLA